MDSRERLSARIGWFVAALACNVGIAGAQAQCTSTPIATLVPTDAMVNDMVGSTSMAISASGGLVLLGSAGHSHVSSITGSAWIISPPGAAAAKTVELTPTPGVNVGWFAYSLAMNGAGDRFVAGAPAVWPGARPSVHVFHFDGASWIEEWSMVSPPPKDMFGLAVSMNDAGDLIAVGAPQRLIPPDQYFYGAVDLYRRQATTWVIEKTIVKNTENQYGSRIALSGDGNLLAVRSVLQQVNGSVDLYERDSGIWTAVGNLHESISHSGNGGFATAIDVDTSGQTVVVGSYYDARMGYMSGAVFMFRNGPAGWFLEGEMLLPMQGIGYALGLSVSINGAGDRVLAGAQGYVLNGERIGAVFEYKRVNGVWQQADVYTSPSPDKDAAFGRTVALSATGRRWVASEPFSDRNIIEGGLVQVFESACTQPAVYCTAQANSLGCVPRIGSQGTPSASAPNSFEITLADTRNQRSGLCFYGTVGSLAQPWYGGTLCVQPPLRRTPLQDSGGTPLPADDCSGSLSFDFNAWYGGDPALYPGVHVFAQYLSRDPSPTSQVNLSDALEFYVEP